MIAEFLLPVVILSRVFIFDTYRAPSSSMLPTIEPGDIFVANKIHSGHYGFPGFDILTLQLGGSYQPGDIIVFQYPPDPKIAYFKRVIATGGDTIEYSARTLSINNEAIESTVVGDNLNVRRECLGNTCYCIQWESRKPRGQTRTFSVPRTATS
jgi:signal peptidase I